MWDCYEDRFKLQEVGDNFQMLQGGSVTSVNGKVGAVVLTAEDVGALPDTYEAPVTSVNTKTGAVVLDSGDIAYESTTVEEELGTINSALSSLSSVTEIIDTASGAIASFPDGSGLPMRSLVAEINPVQDLHGQSSPWPAGGGKNKLENKATSDTVNNVSFTVNSDGSVNIQGVPSGRANFYLQTAGASNQLPTGSYILSLGVVKSQVMLEMTIKDGGGTTRWISAKWDTGGVASFTIEENDTIQSIYISAFASYDGSAITAYPMIRLATESDATYAPYSNICPISGHTGLSGWVEDEYDPTAQSTFSVSWQDEAGTVYGGTDEIVGGELTSTMGIVDLGDLNWSYDSGTGSFYVVISDIKLPPSDNVAVNALTSVAPVISNADRATVSGIRAYVPANARTFYIRGSGYTDVASFKTAMSGQQLVYEMDTPTTFTHTGQQIDTLYGQNNIWVDTGDVSVTYQASIKGYIDKVLGS